MMRSKLCLSALSWITLAAAAATAVLTGCQDDDRVLGEGEETIRLLHDVEGLDQIEVYGDGVLLAMLRPGELSEAIAIDENDLVIEVYEAGTTLKLVSRSVELTDDGLHIVALSAEAGATAIDVVVVDEQAPIIGPDEAALEVLNLLEPDVEIDVFVGDVPIATRPSTNSITGFTVVDEDEDLVRIFRADADPDTATPLSSLRLPLLGSSATLLILTDEVLLGAEPRLSITNVPLQ